MCIISVHHAAGFTVLTFNRDETAERPFLAPQTNAAGSIFAPVDLLSGGTWIGLNAHSIMCIQNGGRQKHVRMPPYGKSRGLVLQSVLEQGIPVLKQAVQGSNVEPFTMTCLNLGSSGPDLQLYYYDGQAFEQEQVGIGNGFIRFSSTLYTQAIAEQISIDFQSVKQADADALLDFHIRHRIGGPGNPYSGRPVTSSIIQFLIGPTGRSCRFHNLLDGSVTHNNDIVLS